MTTGNTATAESGGHGPTPDPTAEADDEEDYVMVPVSKERQELIEILKEVVGIGRDRLVNGRVTNAENEKTRQGWLNGVVRACAETRRALNDNENDKLNARLDKMSEMDLDEFIEEFEQ